MPSTSTMGYPLEAFLVIDNNAIVSLCEFYCDSFKGRSFPEIIQLTCNEVSVVFDTLRRFALGNKVYTTDCVLAEFKPEFGVIRNYAGFSQRQVAPQ